MEIQQSWENTLVRADGKVSNFCKPHRILITAGRGYVNRGQGTKERERLSQQLEEDRI